MSPAPDATGGGGRTDPAARSLPALRRVVGVAARDFVDKVWATRPLLSRADDLPGALSDLFGPRAVDELVSSRGLRTPFLRMAKEGSVIAPARFTRGGGAGATIADQVADDKVLDRMADGATLVLQALHRTWPPLVSFASDLALDLGHPVQINAYVTPPQNQGFAPHFDTHDVFVLQIAGRKHWRIHEPVVAAPLPEQNWERYRTDVEARAAEEPLIDTVLEPGDALYLPRGFLHSATALGELSIHLTVGVHPVTRRNLVRELLTRSTSDARVRQSLPAGTDLSDPGVLGEHVRAAAAVLIEQLQNLSDETIAELAAAVGTGLSADTRPEPLAPLRQAETAAALTPDTSLRVRRGLRATMTTADGVVLRVLDKTVSMPADVEAAVKTVLSGQPVRPADLPGLDPEQQLGLARRLLREGIAVPAETDPRDG